VNSIQREVMEALDDLFRPEPYHGLRYKLVCPQCSGATEIAGRNYDDPKWMMCPGCGGSGLTPNAQRVRDRLREVLGS
jgi:hypothetical protein